jgi:hypothetical protein
VHEDDPYPVQRQCTGDGRDRHRHDTGDLLLHGCRAAFVQNGSLKPIALGDDRRSVQLPDVPTFKEQGVDFTMGTWFGLRAD